MTDIRFRFRHCFNGQSDDLENSFALRALLDCLTTINVAALRRHSLPRLYESGVRYRRIQIWEPILEVYERGEADCKALSAILIAEYTVRGIDAVPVFRFARNSDGNDFHILVMVPKRNGLDRTLFEDPSAKLGMHDHHRFYRGE